MIEKICDRLEAKHDEYDYEDRGYIQPVLREAISIVQEVAREYDGANVRSNADRIRNMSDEELNTFLWWFKISEMALFMQDTEERPMDALEQLNFLKASEEMALQRYMQKGE